MTINGPAHNTGIFMNAAIDQLCEKWIEANSQWPDVDGIYRKNLRICLTCYYNPALPDVYRKVAWLASGVGVSGDIAGVYENKAEALSGTWNRAGRY